MKIYRVGGYVRDKLLGRKAADCDYVVVGATQEQMLKLGYIQVGSSFPVFLHPKTHEEYALARTEQKIGTGHCGFSVFAAPSVTLEQDLLRRDLTINAIAETADGQLIDPYHGIADLKHKILRHVSSAFSEDPLRILRVARFAAYFSFDLAPETRELLQEMAQSGDGLAISRERVVRELEKALASKNSENFFATLLETGNLSVFFPNLTEILKINYRQFIQDIRRAVSVLDKYCILSLYSTNLTELSLSKERRKFMQRCQVLHATISAWKQQADYLLPQLRRLDIWRQPDLFQACVTSYAQLLEHNQRVTQLEQLRLLETIAIDLQQQELSHLINPEHSQQQIASTVNDYYLALIKQLCK